MGSVIMGADLVMICRVEGKSNKKASIHGIPASLNMLVVISIYVLQLLFPLLRYQYAEVD